MELLQQNVNLLIGVLVLIAFVIGLYLARKLQLASDTIRQQLVNTSLEHKRLETIFNASPSGMLIVRPDGRIDKANTQAEQILGFDSGTLKGSLVETLIPEELRDRHLNDRNHFTRNPVSRAMGRDRTLMAQRFDGSRIPVEVGLTPIDTDNGPMVIASLTDRSEAEQAREALEKYVEALERSNNELDQFAYIASHDLRSPLRGISQLAQFIQEDAGNLLDEDSKNHLVLLRKRVSRLDNLLNDLLQYSRIGRVDSEPSQLDTHQIINEAIDMHLSDTNFILEVEGDIPGIFAPKALFELVLRNLIMNAVKHHDRGRGKIRVSAKQENGYCHLFVRDDGPGIPLKYHDKVFQMFKTLKRRDEVEGSGMGLAIIEKAMMSCHGEVSLEQTEGRGATFRLSFPRAE